MSSTYEVARTGVVIFDNGSDGRFRISGPEADQLNALVSVNLDQINPFHGAVGLVTQPDAQLIAITLIFKGADDYYLFTEAEAADALYAHLVEALAGRNVVIEDLRQSHAWLSIAGPLAQEVIVEAAGEDTLGLPYLSWEDNASLGCALFRVGFAGEFEYRFLAPTGEAAALRSALEAAGQAFGMIRGDAEALPLMMLEVRSPLHRDVVQAGNVLEAGLHWMINFRKPDLVGRGVLHDLKRSLRRRGLMIALRDPGAVEGGDRLSIEGEEVGVMARVEHSPTLGQDIGLAFVDAEFGWVGVSFEVAGARGRTVGCGISAPTLMTRSIYTS